MARKDVGMVKALARSGELMALWANRRRKWLFVLPAMVFLVLMTALPLGYTVFLSFTDARGSVNKDLNFIGWENFTNVLSDTSRFWPAVRRTVEFTAGAVALELILGFIIALLLRKPFRGQGLVRVAILLPLVATPVAVGMMWLLILDPNVGVVPKVMASLHLPRFGFISDPESALGTLMLIDVWQWTPMVALILLAGLTSLTDEVEEAARVDGAGLIKRLWHVTIPMLRPSIIAATLLRIIDALKTYDILYATKGKGGGSFHEVETLNIYAYGTSFEYNRYGLSAAVLVLYMLMILAVVLLLLLQRRRAD
jgi:multiple sugar transport system permease protein